MASRNDVIAVAQTYLDGVMSGDGSGVLLAPDAWRVEQGMNSGVDAAEIRRSLDRMGGFGGMRDLRWFVDGDDAVAFYVLDVGPFTSFIVERIHVVDSLITEIEVVFHGREGANLERWPVDRTQVWPKDADGNYLIR